MRYSLVVLLGLLSALSLKAQLIENVEEGVRLGAIPSEIQPPTSDLVRPLLEAICPGHVIRNDYFQQLGCDGKAPEPGNATWRPPLGVNGVLHGHFLSPSSEDLILSGNRMERHPLHWGGTLLMTKEHGDWKPLWYRGGIITRHCMTVLTDSGRQILVCEQGIGEQGHKSHVLYSVELQADNPVEQILIATDTYTKAEEKQTQTVELVRVASGAGGPSLQVRVHHARYVCHKEWFECGESDYGAADPPPGEYTLNFVFQGARLVLSPASRELFKSIFPELANYDPQDLISNGEPPQPR